MAKIIQLKDKNNDNLYPNVIIKQLLNLIYPVGSLYISSNSTNPSAIFGGSWVRTCIGRVLVGVDENQSEFNSVEKTGGEKTHTLTVNEIPSHSHKWGYAITAAHGSAEWTSAGNNKTGINTDTIMSTGGDQPHNNLPPYQAYYIFKRTA